MARAIGGGADRALGEILMLLRKKPFALCANANGRDSFRPLIPWQAFTGWDE
jgi:hypothetical protein